VIDIENGWSNEIKNGFGSFLLQPMDCSTTVTIDCLSNRVNSSIQYSCHTSFNNHEINCNSIRLTFQRNQIVEEKKVLVQLQLTALAKQPCFDKDIFYQCQESYPNSCIDKSLHCNGRSECPRGDDERACHQSTADGIPLIVIILLIIAFLVLICIVSTVLVCCCCRAAFNSIIRRFRTKNNNSSNEKGNVRMAHGEDAGLIKGLNSSNVVEILPEQHLEPTAVLIDSTKPVYPRLD